MKLDIKPSTALTVGGIILAAVFVAIAIISPDSLDWILNPGEERSDQIKKVMDRQKESAPEGRSDPQLKRDDQTRIEAITPTPTPIETVRGGEIPRNERTSRAECISRDQVIKVIGASDEARDGRVIGISVTPDGYRIKVAYRKKSFLGIGSGENQIEGIIERGLRNQYPERLIKSVRVRSEGNKSVRQGEKNVNVEVLEIDTLQAGRQCP